MSRAFGMPGVGGSLGKCCYCGDTFMAEILLGTTCRGVEVGGQKMFVHTRTDGLGTDCFGKLVAIAEGGGLSIGRWADFPEGSPLREAMQKLALAPTEKAGVE